MAEILQSTGVIPPEDLLPDDTTLIYKNGEAVAERDYTDPYYNDEHESRKRDFDRYVTLALAYYNSIHHTDYKAVPKRVTGETYLEIYGDAEKILIHCGFTAFPVGCESDRKYFCSKLFQAEFGGKEVVTSCAIADGIEPVGCKVCDSRPPPGCHEEEDKDDDDDTQSVDSDSPPPPSEYTHLLADGVTLSDRAKLRLRFTLIALSYYNHKHHTDYKLVDVLPYCMAFAKRMVVHCNFIAKQNVGADTCNKLFFAELEYREKDFAVTACRVVRGKTRAGCHHCPRHLGKRVIHPPRGYRFGLYPGRSPNGPRLRRRESLDFSDGLSFLAAARILNELDGPQM